MIQTATTSTFHSAFFSSITQVGLGPSPEANYFVNELFNSVPCPSSSSSFVLNKAAKQGLIDSTQKKAKMDARALQKQKFWLLLDDSLEDENVEIKRVKKEKGTLKNKAKDSVDRWQSDEEEHAAKRRCWEEKKRLKQEFLNDQYLHEGGYTKDGGKIGWTQHQLVAAMSVAARWLTKWA
ncbi:hypothetical protein O181_061060 [Austropuccinia psidii MF-1]|uniref:Uncharacterized protein n=1 Tax=Austropuccinia psidii MF-1 TaxID=1389203 RepID=A0A9Q3ELM2_9BASI|nr:hypothetical protein [Austropuccinia psidii MF-1]